MYAKATEVLNAPDGGDAGRIRKMMSARPTLNANQRRSKVRGAPQDPAAFSPEGTMVGRGGRVQAAGPAMQRRLAAQPPPGSVTPDMIAAMQNGPAAPQIGGGAPSDMALQAAQAGGAAPDMAPPQAMRQPMQIQGDALQAALARRGLAGGAGMETPEMGGQVQPFGQGLPPQIIQRLQALRGGGLQGGGMAPGVVPGGGMSGPRQRSFQDFWQGGGMAY